MDPLHLSIALGPLAVYLICLGGIQLSSRPFITTGGRDVAALGIAVSGLVVAGPMQLFMPRPAEMLFGGYVWLLLFVLYTLWITLLALVSRPRLLIFNFSEQELRALLNSIVDDLDSQAAWAGDCLVLPTLRVQLHIESQSGMRLSQLVSSGPRQDLRGWGVLATHLKSALAEVRVSPNRHGLVLFLAGSAAAVLVSFWMITERLAVAQTLREILQ